MHSLLLSFFAIIFCLVPLSSIAAAAYLAGHDKSGWGWFLIVAVMTASFAAGLLHQAMRQMAKGKSMRGRNDSECQEPKGAPEFA